MNGSHGNRTDAPSITGDTLVTSSPILRRMVHLAAPSWSRVLNTPFVRQATDGSLPTIVLARYLRLEEAFVETSTRARGAAILIAPTAEAINGHYRSMSSLVADQRGYLRHAQQLLQEPAPISPEARQQASRLSDRMIDLASQGDYAKLLTAITTTEILYRHWCGSALKEQAERNPVLQQWVADHTRPPFTDDVDFLVSQMNATTLTDGGVVDAALIMAEILDLEDTFHDAAYLP